MLQSPDRSRAVTTLATKILEMTRNAVICGEHIESVHFSGLEINLNPVFLGDLGPNLSQKLL